MVRTFICFYNIDIYSDNRYGYVRVYGKGEINGIRNVCKFIYTLIHYTIK